MSPFLQFALALALIVVAAKLGGLLSNRLGQPSVLGELLAGLILGPSLLDFLHWAPFTDEHLGESIIHLAEIGVLLLMFIAGLDLHLTDLLRSGKVAALAGILGVIGPLGLGFGVGLALSPNASSALFIGLVLSATSVSISAQTLMELGALRSRVGVSLLGAAVFDDILVVLGLSAFVAFAGGDVGPGAVVTNLLRMLLYVGAGAALGTWLLPRLGRWVDDLPISQGLIAFTFTMILLYAWSAEIVGNMAAITGAFLAGLLFARSPSKERIEAGMSVLAYGVFVPIFFVSVGLQANLRMLDAGSALLLLAMTVVAILGKVFGAGLGGRFGGLSGLEALQLGVGMMSRGEVGLIVASVGILEGLIDVQVFSAVVGMVIITTLLTPPALRALFAKQVASRTLEWERD